MDYAKTTEMAPHSNQMSSSSRLLQAIQATVDAARAEDNQDVSFGFVESRKATPTIAKPRAVHLTAEQWQLLADYHEHDVFVKSRSWGFCLAIFGVGVTLFGLGSPAWIWIGEMKNPNEMGIWTVCYANGTCFPLIYYLENDWKLHTTIICLLASACLFGLLGLGMAITGACRSALILRLYYYHSAGECFLVSSAAIAGALCLYPMSAKACLQNLTNHHLLPRSHNSILMVHRFAYNYYLSWVASLFFATSFVFMNLDLIIQSCVRPMPLLSNLFSVCSTAFSCCKCRKKHSQVPNNKSTHGLQTAISLEKENTCHKQTESHTSKLEKSVSRYGEANALMEDDEVSVYEKLSSGDDGDWI